MKSYSAVGVVTVLGGLALTGCATTTVTTPSEPPARVAHDPSPHVGNPVVSWGHDGRAGAAERQPGYVHMIGRKGQVKVASAGDVRPAAFTNTAPPATPVPIDGHVEPLGPSFAEAIAAAGDIDGKTLQPQSLPEDALRRAWRRYCDGGKDLTDADWQLLKDAGAPENVPRDLARDCVHPK